MPDRRTETQLERARAMISTIIVPTLLSILGLIAWQTYEKVGETFTAVAVFNARMNNNERVQIDHEARLRDVERRVAATSQEASR